MGFTINKEITTKLHYKDIALIATTFGNHIELYGITMNKEQKSRMNNLVNRLGSELANCKQ